MRLLVTGGAGFIGSHFIRLMMTRRDVTHLINLDKLTYAANLENLREFTGDRRYRFVRGDIASPLLAQRLMKEVDAVVNFAAETHVDRSIHDAAPFLHTNVVGVQVLLEAAKTAKLKRFLHVSTDEVYGSLSRGFASEKSNLNPRSPYSASKAAADHLVMAYYHTYGLPILITRSGNNYGPFQYPEKFLPLFITHALTDRPLPLYGDGLNVREWLHVSDHCLGIERVLRRGRVSEIYNIGTGRGWPNLTVARQLLRYLHKPESLIWRVPDRLGHDRRYALSTAKIRRELGWSPAIRFEDGLLDTIEWYKTHRPWWEMILYRSRPYQRYYRKQYAGRKVPSARFARMANRNADGHRNLSKKGRRR
jgi:dTDP-glucose 4,6-dehydratase